MSRTGAHNRSSLLARAILGAGIGAAAVLLLLTWLRPPAAPPAPTPAAVPAEAPSALAPGRTSASPGVPPAPAFTEDAVLPLFKGALARDNRSESEWIAILGDPAQPLTARREAGRFLAKQNSPEARAAVLAALASGPPHLKAAIAEGLGASSAPEAKEILRGLLSDPDETTARGAVRGWAIADGDEAVRVLNDVLSGPAWAASVRDEAALGLGDLKDRPDAFAILTNVAWQARDQDVAPAILEGLGRRRADETQAFFREFLSAPDTPAALRVAAVEALGQAEGNSAPLLLEFLRDGDAEVRAGAAWALSATEESDSVGGELLARLREETTPEVRRRLYQALGNQQHIDVNSIVDLLAAERQPDVRLAGLGVVARTCRESPNPQLIQYFDQAAVPELRASALGSDNQEQVLASIAALRTAQTPGARTALEEIARAGRQPEPAGNPVTTGTPGR